MRGAAIMLAGLAALAGHGGVTTAAAAGPSSSHAAAAPVPPAADLRRDSRDAARAGEPLVLFFSLPDCAYCHTVRHNYLTPLLRSQAAPQGGYVIREIEVGGSRAAFGQDGAATTHAALAKRYGVRFAPTVLFVGPAGEALAPPLLGGDTAGMYGAYLDDRLATARQAATGARSIAAPHVNAARAANERTIQ